MKKKLFFALNNLDLGGIEKSMINLLNVLDYNKYDITILLQEKRGIFLDDVPKNVKIKEYKLFKCKIVIIRKILNRLKIIMYCLFNYHKYDYSCAYATYDIPSTIIARYLSKNNSIFVHGDYLIAYGEKGFYQFFNDRKIDKFKSIVFVSEDSKVKFVEKYKKLKNKCIAINNQVDIKDIKKKAKEKIEIEKKGYTFIYIGRLDEKAKRISKMINAMTKIKEANLWIIGDGPDKEMYQEIIEKHDLGDRIILFGKKHNPYKYLDKADSLLLTSDYEGFPVVYLESLALKKQIVTTFPIECNGLNISDYAYIIKNDEDILKKMNEVMKKPKKIDFDVDNFNKDNLRKLEAIINDKI